MSKDPNLHDVKSYFDKRIREHGATPRGVDWNSETSQTIRFDQLVKVIDDRSFSVLDYGCGYGALADYLATEGFDVDYYGFDILESAVETARQAHAGQSRLTFSSDRSSLPVCDYVIASGIFNYMAAESPERWTDYILTTLNDFNKLSSKGFSSNFLTKYSDADKMRADLYYADPMMLFDHCKRNYSRNVAILHDYELYDFTLLVRK